MNILMALSQLEVTGAEVYGVTLADELIKRGNNVYIVSDTLTKPTKAEYFKIEFNKRSLSQRISHVKELLRIIKEKDIQVVHAHSRASSWSSAIACKIAGIPLITTTHGRQPIHFSRKLIKGFGDYGITVCENIYRQLVDKLGVKENKICVLRNPVSCEEYDFSENSIKEKIIISIIGRLSGPKGEICYDLLERLYKNEKYQIQVIGGKEIPERFKKFQEKVKFLGYVNDVPQKIKDSSIIIGAGRVAMEGILSGRPVIAVGEQEYIGLVSEKNIEKALSGNFGDVVIEYNGVDISNIEKDIEEGINLKKDELLRLRDIIKENFSIKTIVDNIEKIYSKQYVLKKKYEIPVIMYHRIIRETDEKGVHGIYVLDKVFDEQMKYLKENGYQTITFEDIKSGKYRERFNRGNKWIMITFDDGYKDNYEVAFPILKKYGFKGTIYLLGEAKYNSWDVNNPKNPEKKFILMDDEEILEMQEYGIEFGGHTLNHPMLARLDLEKVKKEILESKKITEKMLGKKMNCFAYPYGNLSEEVKEIVKEAGYEFAVATDSGDITFDKDLFQIRRIAIFPKNNMLSFKRKVSGKYNFIKIKREHKKK
ncbi:MAG: polysaccharide deacetylase family protein [Fusobacterium perfoetens]|uniref:polysaccharide deacetylase family protein n=1 Tax=Fusobacterium perfoetens TaxID=852 RepID=UPI0023F3681C|nr:polysaccharide deacetylase family protein [Fusobacterium perfoetens]MCI6151791.1 polysaccharide deacetylase family protein [Fusobacterium perfoetens]MDY3236848.1 polysaccharide deacetylase family protein [Fusobacterium perfoetens]